MPKPKFIAFAALAPVLASLSGCQLSQQVQQNQTVFSPSHTQAQELIKPPLGPGSPGPLQLLQGAHPLTCCQPVNLGLDEQLWQKQEDKEALLKAINYSLRYLDSDAAISAYREYAIRGITVGKVRRSLERFRQLVLASQSSAQLQAAVQREFKFYQSVGNDGWGKVLFSAYYEPIYQASRVQTPEYRYPIYKRPANLDNWSRPHPTRADLEGEDGLQGPKGRLAGLELFWLKDRWEAYQIHVEGSAQLRLTDGTQTSVNYADNIRRNYTSIGWELAQDGKLELEKITWPKILDYFQKNPQEINDYMTRDKSFVFFKETHGQTAKGSLNQLLHAERSIATDKRLMPPGALALIHTDIPTFTAPGKMENLPISRYVLDQDTGGAIKGAGRVDYFLGAGEEAGERAGVTRSYGQLYYLLLKD